MYVCVLSSRAANPERGIRILIEELPSLQVRHPSPPFLHGRVDINLYHVIGFVFTHLRSWIPLERKGFG